MANKRRAGPRAAGDGNQRSYSSHTIADTLRTLPKRNRAEHLYLLESLRSELISGPSNTALAAYITTDLATTLIDILREKQTGDHITSNGGTADFPMLVLFCTGLLVQHFHSAYDESSPVLEAHLAKILTRSLGLWNGLWTKHVIQYILETDVSPNALAFCTHLTDLMVALFKAAVDMGDTTDLVSSKAWHLALICWTVNPKFSRRRALQSSLLQSIIVVCSHAETQVYVQEAIVDLRLEKRVLERWIKDLPLFSVEKPAMTCFILFLYIVTCNPSVKRARAELDTMPATIMEAARRQLCSGKAEDRMEGLRHCLMQMLEIYELDTVSSGIALTSIWRPCEIVTLISEFSLALARKQQVEVTDHVVVSCFCDYYAHDLEQTSDAVKKADILTALRSLWQKTLDQLNTYLSSCHRDSYESQLLCTWATFGDKFCTVEPITWSYFSTATPHPKACQSTYCLCFDRPSPHKMRVCKGCWQARYCSKKCQKDAWRDHKEECSSGDTTDDSEGSEDSLSDDEDHDH